MSRALHRYAITVALATFGLIIAGALVTSTGSALAVPDWPLSYGRFFPPMVGGIFYEHGHRMIASTVGFLTVILAFWLWRSVRGEVTAKLGFAALLMVILQGVLGGITVLLLLPTIVSVAHACLGQTFFCVIVTIALITSPMWRSIQRSESTLQNRRLVRAAFLTTGMIYIQLILGAIMRHSEAGLAIPDFPLAFGKLIPSSWDSKIAIHFLHRSWAYLVCASVIWTFTRAWKVARSEGRIFLPALTLLLLVILQVTLGAFTVWTEKAVPVTTAHVATGASILAISLILSLIAGRRFGIDGIIALQRSASAYFELTKPRITMLVLVTTAAGYYLAAPVVRWGSLLVTLFATALVASGASALNEYIERDFDKLMKRTANRPLPEGRIPLGGALFFSLTITLLGLLIFQWKTNPLAMFLALVTVVTYLGLYTPMKRYSAFCTVVGALPGALPPLIGWAAATGHLNYSAGVLFAILFLWQLPHFWAIAWMYKEDYERAGFPMLPVVDPTGSKTSRETIFSLVALVAVAAFPVIAGLAGPLYSISAGALGILFLISGVRLARERTKENARRVLLASVTYLPLVLILMVIDKQ